MTTDQKGAIAETAIVHAATKLGIPVSRPVSPQRYDLVFDLGVRLVRVQCKWAVLLDNVVLVRCYRARRGRDHQIIESYTTDEIDAVAAYCRELDRSYFIPFNEFPRRRSFHLRLKASRNNQRRKVLWANEFDLEARLRQPQGAVAQLGERCDGIAEVRGSIPLGSIV
jgi:PD-(D/E)XK endonuclease